MLIVIKCVSCARFKVSLNFWTKLHKIQIFNQRNRTKDLNDQQRHEPLRVDRARPLGDDNETMKRPAFRITHVRHGLIAASDADCRTGGHSPLPEPQTEGSVIMIVAQGYFLFCTFASRCSTLPFLQDFSVSLSLSVLLLLVPTPQQSSTINVNAVWFKYSYTFGITQVSPRGRTRSFREGKKCVLPGSNKKYPPRKQFTFVHRVSRVKRTGSRVLCRNMIT